MAAINKILVAVDSFKNCLSSIEIEETVARAIHEVHPACAVKLIPMADGGEGFASIYVANGLNDQYQRLVCDAYDANEQPISAEYYYSESTSTVVLELASTLGIERINLETSRPLSERTSYGMGVQMQTICARHHPQKIIIGLGSSAINDAGIGLLRALGFRFYNHQGVLMSNFTLSEIAQLAHIEPSTNTIIPELVLACDVTNPLYGPEGCTYVFGPQKGLIDSERDVIDTQIKNWGELVKMQLGTDLQTIPGSGAAGGVASALMLVSPQFRVQAGFDIIKEQTNLKKWIDWADLIITGEGKFDSQSLQGKVVGSVLSLIKPDKKAVILCGLNEDVKLSNNVKILNINDGYDNVENCLNSSIAKSRIMTKTNSYLKAII